MPTDKPKDAPIAPDSRTLTEVVRALNKVDTEPKNIQKNRNSISDNNGGRIKLDRDKGEKQP